MEVVIIPAYEPDEKLIDICREISEAGLSILVVDDGSGEKYADIFSRAGEYAKVTGFKENHGKGAALKLGFSQLLEYYPECTHFITADSDGQHKALDIIRVRDELINGAHMVLSVRRLRDKIPARSKFGNDLSKVVYTTLTGHYFTDNQSGLRGFSACDTEWLCKVPGERYDYEMNMLYYADKQAIPITTIQIEAIYIDGNSSSHFRPVPDTVRIYKSLFKSAAATFITALLCEILVLAASLAFKGEYIYFIIPSIGAFCALVSILLNKFIFFRNVRYGDGFRTIIYTIFRYGAYTVLCMLLKFILPGLPLFWNFNIVVLISFPFEYLIRKGIHASAYKDFNKE